MEWNTQNSAWGTLAEHNFSKLESAPPPKNDTSLENIKITATDDDQTRIAGFIDMENSKIRKHFRYHMLGITHLDLYMKQLSGTVLTCKIPGSKSAKCLRSGRFCSLARTNAAAALADSVLI